jgi:2-C-methyl-D-erythritol 4-phosphate cytidylyltransferase
VSNALILVAAGTGSRAGVDKLWVNLGGRPLLAYPLETAAAATFFDRVVVVAPRARWDDIRGLAATNGLNVTLTEGGARRQDSVAAGLAECQDIAYVCVHDAARPLCSARLMQAVLDTACKFAAATAAIAVTDTIKRVQEGVVVETLERDHLVAVQTPQAFDAAVLREAHQAAERGGWEAGDDAALVEKIGVAVHVVEGEKRNLKVTTAEDFVVLEAFLEQVRT